MGLEETLIQLESEREQPSLLKGLARKYLTPTVTGTLAAIITKILTDNGDAALQAGIGVYGTQASLQELTAPQTSAPTFIGRYKRTISYLGAGIKHITWYAVSPFAGFGLTYPVVRAVLGLTDTLTRYKPTSSVAKTLRTITTPTTLAIGTTVFAITAHRFSYGYTHFPAATFFLNCQHALHYALPPYLGLLTLAKLTDRATYTRLSNSALYWTHTLLGNKQKARTVLQTQQQHSTDTYEQHLLAHRLSNLSWQEGKLDNSLLPLEETLTTTAPSPDIFSYLRQLPNHIIRDMQTFLSLINPHVFLPQHLPASLAVLNALERNYDLALHITYTLERQASPADKLTYTLLSALLHQHARSPKTQTAYAYAAARTASCEELLKPAGTSRRAKLITPTKPFLSKHFLFYFGDKKELEAQEKNRQTINETVHGKASTPHLLCPPTSFKNQAFSTYAYDSAPLISTTRTPTDFLTVARILGHIHAHTTPPLPPRDYHPTLQQRITTLPQELAHLVLTSWHALWHYIGKDEVYDRDSHGNNYATHNGNLTILDFKPRPPNHRVIDLAKLLNHTPLFSNNYNAHWNIIDNYTAESHVRPDQTSLLCAAPLVAINSLYFTLVEKNEPGFCHTYLTNAENALTQLFTHHHEEYLRFENEFNTLKQAIILARNITKFSR